MVENRFAKCESVEEVVFQAIGAGSVCWENLGQAGVFLSQDARTIGEEAVERIKEMTEW